MAKLVEKTYADALFDLAKEKDEMDVLLAEAEGVGSVLKENTELVQFINHPKISREEKERVVENIFKDRVSEDMTGFLLLIIRKNRQNSLDRILSYFVGEVKEFKKIGAATVTSACELSAAQKKAVEDKLISTTKYDSFEINYLTDESLMGGIVIRVGDKVIDSSLRTKITAMSRELYNS